MMKKLSQAALLIAGGLALGGCPFEQQAATTAPKPPAADYQAPVPPSPPATNIRAICYTPTDLATMRARMVQMELNVVTLQCQTKGGARAYEPDYAKFISKFQPQLAANTQSLQQISRRKRFNIDVLVTEFANRTGQRAQTDKEFCDRGKRALDWALSQQVTTLDQVPPPYDIGPEMNIWPCPSP